MPRGANLTEGPHARRRPPSEMLALGLRIIGYLTGGWRTHADVAKATGLGLSATYRWMEYVLAAGVPVLERKGPGTGAATSYHVTRAALARHLRSAT